MEGGGGQILGCMTPPLPPAPVVVPPLPMPHYSCQAVNQHYFEQRAEHKRTLFDNIIFQTHILQI